MALFEDPLKRIRTPEGTRVFVMQVTSVNEEERTVVATFEGRPGGAVNVIVVKPTRSDFSLPAVDDRILVVFDPYDRPFMLGVLEVRAADKIAEGTLRQPHQGETNIFTAFGTKLLFNRSGDIRLEDVLRNGFRSLSRRREVRVASRLIKLVSTSIEMRLGDVKRALPGKDEQPIQGAQGGSPTKVGILQELFIDFVDAVIPTFRYLKLRAGDVTDELGLPEVSSQTGDSLRLKLEITNRTGLESLDVEIDNNGNLNVQLPSTAAQGIQVLNLVGDLLASLKQVTLTTVKGTTIVSPLIKLGSDTASENAVLGKALQTLYEQLTVPTAFGPSGTPINAPSFSTVLSQKVFLE